MVSDYPSRHVENSETNKKISIISSKQLHKKIESFENEKVQLHKTRSKIKNEKVESFEKNLQLQNKRSPKIPDRQKSYQHFSDTHAVYALCEEPIRERGQNALEAVSCVQKVEKRAGPTRCTDLAQAHIAVSGVSEVQSPLLLNKLEPNNVLGTYKITGV